MIENKSLVEFTYWIESVFGTPELDHSGDLEDFIIDLNDRKTELVFLTKLLQSPAAILQNYTAHQIGQGLNYLFDGLYQDKHVFLDSSLDWNLQKKGIESIEILFQEIFAKLSEPSHPKYANSKMLDYTCLMWWDGYPTWGAPSDEFMSTHHDDKALNVMERILYCNSISCVESALHGLNHWVFNYRERVHQIIDKFLNKRGKLPSDIINQAEWAKAGTMQ